LGLHPDCQRICSGKNSSNFFNKSNEYNISENSIINVEIDANKKTVFFFINYIQCPYYISNIPDWSLPLLFGICGYQVVHSVIEIISIKKLLRSTASNSVECVKIDW
jgi:hypothetical protein